MSDHFSKHVQIVERALRTPSPVMTTQHVKLNGDVPGHGKYAILFARSWAIKLIMWSANQRLMGLLVPIQRMASKKAGEWHGTSDMN